MNHLKQEYQIPPPTGIPQRCKISEDLTTITREAQSKLRTVEDDNAVTEGLRSISLLDYYEPEFA